MGGAIPGGVNWHAVAERYRHEAELLGHAMVILTAERDRLRRQLDAAMRAGFSLALEALDAGEPVRPVVDGYQTVGAPAEDPLFRAIRQNGAGRLGPL